MSSITGAPPQKGATARKGILDLRGHAWANSTLELHGEWKFHPGRLRTGVELARSSNTPNFIIVPGPWNKFRKSSEPGFIGTYRLTILTKDPPALKLYIPNVHTAYSLYINGELRAGAGRPGEDAKKTRPQLRPRLVDVSASSGKIEIVLAVANFHHRNGGLWKAPRLARRDILERQWERGIAGEWLQFGLFMGIAFLFLVLFIGSLRHRELLLFSLVCAVMGLRAVLTQNRALVQLWPEFPFEINYALEYLTFYLSPPLFASMVFAMFTNDSSRPAARYSRFVLYGINILGAGLCAGVVFFPSSIYTRTFTLGLLIVVLTWVFVLFILLRYAFRGEKEAILILTATLVPLAATINDYLHNRNVISSAYLTTESLLVFFLFMAMVVGLRVRRIEMERNSAYAENRARGEFFSMMSHELRTPLNAMFGMIQLMGDTPLNEKQKEYLSILRKGGRGLLALVNDILDISRMEAGKLEIRENSLDLRALLQELMDLFQGQAAEKNLALELHIHKKLPELIITDEFRLRQIFMNLLGNAVKFTEHGGVTLDVRMDANETLSFSVIDSGPGIPADKQQIIFESFAQVGSSTPGPNQGSGLGLAITRRLVDAMGGSLRLESSSESGSKFTVRMKVHRAPATIAEQPAVAPDGHAPQSNSTIPRPRILLADDDRISRMLLERFIQGGSNMNAELKAVASGMEAVRDFAPGKYDLVLLDMRMPEMSGTETMTRIREIESQAKQKPIPIIAVTANAMESDVQRALEAGFSDFISKPVDKEEVRGVILRHARANGNDPLKD